MVCDAVGGCHGPEMCDVSIVARCQNASLRHVCLEEICGPEHAGVPIRPCRFTVPGESVDKDDASAQENVSLFRRRLEPNVLQSWGYTLQLRLEHHDISSIHRRLEWNFHLWLSFRSLGWALLVRKGA